MVAHVGQTRAPALIAELESHGIGECVVTGELPARRSKFFYVESALMRAAPLRLAPSTETVRSMLRIISSESRESIVTTTQRWKHARRPSMPRTLPPRAGPRVLQ